MQNIFKNKLFLTLKLSDLISNLGDVIFYMALMNYVLLLDQPALAVSIVTLSETVPILLSIIIGYFSDRTKHKTNWILNSIVIRTILYLIVGFVLGFKPSLIVLIIVAILNFISDIFGQYENLLHFPITVSVLAPEDREAGFAFSQTVSTICNIAFVALGGILVVYFSYNTLAYINSFTFMLAGVIFMLIKKKIDNSYVSEEKPEKTSLKQLPKNIILNFKEAIHSVLQVDEIKWVLIFSPLINSVAGLINSVLLLYLAQNPLYVLVSGAFTIMLLSNASAISRIIGGIFYNKINKYVSLNASLLITSFLISLIYFSFIINNLLLTIILFSIPALILSAVNPKLIATVTKAVDVNKLGSVYAGIDFYSQSASIISKTLFSIIVVFVGLTNIIWGIIILNTIFFLLIAYVVLKSKKLSS